MTNDSSKIFSLYTEATKIPVNFKTEGQPTETDHDETDMSNPEEKREVQIGKEILTLSDKLRSAVGDTPDDPEREDELYKLFTGVEKLAEELIKMHGQGTDSTKTAADAFDKGYQVEPKGGI